MVLHLHFVTNVHSYSNLSQTFVHGLLPHFLCIVYFPRLSEVLF